MKNVILVLIIAVSGWFAPVCSAQDWVYSTRPGDTIWDLTEKYAKSLGYVDALRKHNGIETPRRLKPGTHLRFPLRWLKVQPVTAKLIEVTGAATLVKSGTTESMEAVVGARLDFGDVVETGPDGNVVVEFADGSTLAVRDDSRLEFDKLSAYGDTGMVDTRVKLQRGRINVRATPSHGPGTRFQIHTPAAVSAVRGTRFRVAMSPDNAIARTEVTEGVVMVDAAQRTRRVAENFGIVAQVDTPLPQPVHLLPRPDVSSLPELIERVPVKLDWRNLEGAESYRVQVADSEDLNTLLVDRIVNQSAVAFDIAEDGEYFLRLRGIDADKLEGIDLTHRFVLNAYPAPPISMSPEPEATVRIAQPEFVWTEPHNVRAYIFQLAQNPDFINPILDRELTGGTDFTPEAPLEPGKYFWRLATLDQSGEVGPFGDVVPFTFVVPQPAPDLSKTPPAVSKKKIAFRWPEGLEGSTYRVQLARGKNFKKLVADEVVNGPSFTFPDPKSGRYSIRIATIEPDGFVGAFSDPQTIKVPFEGGWWIPLGIWALFILIV